MAIASTLLHEMAHLRHRNHGPRFWALNRRLIDAAAAHGLYVPLNGTDDDAARGDEKLAGSAADAVAKAARSRRRTRAAANRLAAREWAVGEAARITATRGRLAQARVRILSIARGRLTVEAPDGRRYLVPATLLERTAAATPPTSHPGFGQLVLNLFAK